MELQRSLFSQSRGSSTAVEIKGLVQNAGGEGGSAQLEEKRMESSVLLVLVWTRRVEREQILILFLPLPQLAMSSSGEFDIFITSS